MALPPGFADALVDIAGREHVRDRADALAPLAADALGGDRPPDIAVAPGSTSEIAAIARLCSERRVPLVVRGAGTGYTGGAVPVAGGVVLSMERLTRILDIDRPNLLAVVEPNVVTADLQRAVEAVGLFYPPDPASLETSSIGGNVAECAGGPRAFKYGTTKRYVLALEAVLPTGEIIRTGSKAVKNVVGYDLTQLLVGSEGTLAIITKITLRLVPRPPARATLAAAFDGIPRAVAAVGAVLDRHVVPAALELIDGPSLRASEQYAPGGAAPIVPAAGALIIAECDGTPAAAAEEIERVAEAFAGAGAMAIVRAATDEERDRLWAMRRQVSLALRATGLRKINHDVVVPRGRVPQLFDAIADLERRYRLRIACFGHAGDGNIHVNFMIDPQDAAERARAAEAERELFIRVVALEGSISGEHGIGLAKARHLGIELSPTEIALMQRIKAVFDPHGILNPGKIFPPEAAPQGA